MIGIGIDTGGTCTDAVVYEMETKKILAAGKTLTTKSNLEIGIGKALDTLPPELLRKASNFALSTTLSTNACVENKGCRAKLLIIGTSENMIQRLAEVLNGYGIDDLSQLIVLDAKPENLFSEPYDPDWDELERRIPELFSECDSVGIVQCFPNANAGRFEMTALRILQKKLTIPLTIAYDISSETDILKVCASTLLNARLIPLISEFMAAVHHVMEERQMNVPLSIVRSDGTLMSEAMAKTCPVETLLCGPAASAIGGCELAQEPDAILVDMGGTTTDLALVQHQEPAVAKSGILIGQYKTSIKGLDAQAISLGGDTAVRFRKEELFLDTERIIPISVLASRQESVLSDLEEIVKRERPHTRWIHEFYVLQKDIAGKAGYTDAEYRAADILREKPLLMMPFAEAMGTDVYHLDTRRLEQEGVIIRSGLTPTDMMILKGDFGLYDAAAAKIMTQYVAMNVHENPEEIADIVYRMVIKRMYKSIGAYLLHHQFPGEKSIARMTHLEDLLEAFYEQAVKEQNGETNPSDFSNGVTNPLDISSGVTNPSDISSRITNSPELPKKEADNLIARMELSTNLPLIGIGAPIHVFLPEVAKLLHTRAVVPPYAHVANALGAVAGHRVIRFDIPINVEYEGFDISGYAIMADCQKYFFPELQDALDFAYAKAEKDLRERAAFQGFGEDLQIKITHEENRIGNTPSGLLVEIQIHAQAKAK